MRCESNSILNFRRNLNLVKIRLPKKFTVCISIIGKFLQKPNLNEISETCREKYYLKLNAMGDIFVVLPLVKNNSSKPGKNPILDRWSVSFTCNESLYVTVDL